MVRRWIYTDPYVPETYTVPINPREMGSLFAEKPVTSRQTSARDGQALLFEGSAPPAPWTYSGTILDSAHYAELLRWSQKGNRITITDHYGRVIPIYLVRFDPTPKRSMGKPWRHEYTMSALVLGAPSAPHPSEL